MLKRSNTEVVLVKFGSLNPTCIKRNNVSIWEKSPFNSVATSYLKETYPNNWNSIKSYFLAHSEYVSYVNNAPDMAILITISGLFEFCVNNGVSKVDMPVIAIDADDIKENRTWLYTKVRNFTNWNTLSGIMARNDYVYTKGGITPTNNYVTAVGTYNTTYTAGTLVKIFVPHTIPTKFSEAFADGINVYLNGTQIRYNTSYHSNRVDVAYDFSNIIQLNTPNLLTIDWWGSGNHGVDFGLML